MIIIFQVPAEMSNLRGRKKKLDPSEKENKTNNQTQQMEKTKKNATY